ncbi:DNA primase [Sphingomonas qomolangmaensis]|uniref:DNA primase n=1 Tax=Sphingomonas qomolangmaensis TaxID=2918765 RepID=A0ABY5L956_9SPHN|nr:DNA primase [Sphingomonas qomolangmaensis]UUL83322.1 DNA primase [Sphingomonas qomolangmaensis]
MTLTPAFLDELRARTTLSSLVACTVKLQRAGREFRACCPFHNEKSPSFYVNDDKGFYHCFGCGAHGDAIRWMTDHQGLPFMDAVKELAGVAGLDVPAADKRSAERAERAKGLHEVMADAAAWFTEQLHGQGGGEARGLLERRGINAATAATFGLGFAPDSRGKLRAALKDYGDPLLIEAGLLIQVEDKEPYDRFRGRLMIPIRDPRGRVIAFGGRIIGDGEPKYLNSPETPLFDKGRNLYNLDLAQPAARKANRVIAVEGYMDVIALAQAGFGEAVAPLGTAMTESQLERLWRMTDVPLLCFDGDSAGQKAAIRAATRAMPMLAPGRSLAFVTLPQGQDPDDLVRAAGPAAFEALVAKAQPLVDRLWSHEVAAEPLTTPEQRAGLKRRLSDLASSIADPGVRDEYHADFRNRFDDMFARKPAPRRVFQPQRSGGRFDKGRGGWKLPDPPATEGTRDVSTGGIDPVLARAVLAGLIRHPAQIARHIEILGSLKLANATLARLFEAVIDVALEDQALDSGHVLTILARSGFDQVASDLLRADSLPFTFTQGHADEAQAMADLNEAIAVMVARPRVDAALMEATLAVQTGFTDEAYTRQIALVHERARLEARLANLMLPDEDDETLG